MIIDSKAYTNESEIRGVDSGHVLKYCNFKGVSLDGGEFNNVFLSCGIELMDLYWVLFNDCLFVDCAFLNCRFSGVSFITCRFLNCSFVDCEFISDNYNQPCNFNGCSWFACIVRNSKGLPEDVSIM